MNEFCPNSKIVAEHKTLFITEEIGRNLTDCT